MLADDILLALDGVSEACQLVVDHCEHFAESAEEPELTGMFAELAGLHRKYVELIDVQVERLGELPKRPDPDREALQQLATWLRSVFVESKREALLDKAYESEESLKQKIEQTLALDLPADVRMLFSDLLRTAEAALLRIAAARGT